MASRRRRSIAPAVLGIVALGLAAWIGVRLARDRQIDCSTFDSGRAGAICRALGDNLEFEWLGHAIIAPGYKASFETAGRVYCEQKIGADDLPALEKLLDSPDWRIRNGADFLIRLLTGHDSHGTPEPETSIFNPGNPGYLLKDGCDE
jgi:hypothetical protein